MSDFEKNVQSDLELGNMLWFARQAMDLKAEDFMTCTIPGDYYASSKPAIYIRGLLNFRF